MRKEVPVALKWDNLRFEVGYRADLIVTISSLLNGSPSSISRPFTGAGTDYLRLTGTKLGLLINFGEETLKDGVNRVINGTLDEHS